MKSTPNTASKSVHDSDCEIQEVRSCPKSRKRASKHRKAREKESTHRQKKRVKVEGEDTLRAGTTPLSQQEKKKEKEKEYHKQKQKEKKNKRKERRMKEQKENEMQMAKENNIITASPQNVLDDSIPGSPIQEELLAMTTPLPVQEQPLIKHTSPQFTPPVESSQHRETRKRAQPESDTHASMTPKSNHEKKKSNKDRLPVFCSDGWHPDDICSVSSITDDENEYISAAMAKRRKTYTAKTKNKTNGNMNDEAKNIIEKPKSKQSKETGKLNGQKRTFSSTSLDHGSVSESDCVIDEKASTPSPRKIRRSIKAETDAGRRTGKGKGSDKRKQTTDTVSVAEPEPHEMIQLDGVDGLGVHITNDLGLVQFHFEAMQNHVAALRYLANSREVQQQQLATGFRKLIQMIPRMSSRALFVKKQASSDGEE